MGGLLGAGLAEALVKGVMAIMPPFIVTSEADIRVSVPVLLFTLAITVMAAVGFGCAPAWQASGVDPIDALKEGNIGRATFWSMDLLDARAAAKAAAGASSDLAAVPSLVPGARPLRDAWIFPDAPHSPQAGP